MVVPLHHEVRIFDRRPCRLGEGPVWDVVRHRAVWVDILTSRVLWRKMDSDDIGELGLPAHVGAVLPTETNRWLACLPDGVYLTDLESPSMEFVATFPHRVEGGERRVMRANDAKVSPDGFAYCGTMSYSPEEHPGAGALYVLNRDTLQTVVEHATISNGIGWSPDGSVMYFVDSPTGRIDQASYRGPGEPLEWRPFAYIDAQLGVPDGLTVDSAGSIWVAVWGAGQVLNFAPTGSLVGHLQIPCTQTTSCAFVGEDLQTLIITTAQIGKESCEGCGLTYAVDLPTPGLPQSTVLMP